MSEKWKYNSYYFNDINTPEKAYWVGFITADGYIMDNTVKSNKSSCRGLRIRLSVEDSEHLETFNDCIESNKPIKIVKNYGVYENCNVLAEFSLYSKQIVSDLSNLGIQSGNKSCHEKLPNISDDLIKYFILGYFDGDGSISSYINKKKNNVLAEWSIVSSKELTTFIKHFLEENIDIKMQKISKNSKGSNLYRTRTGSKIAIRKIRDYLYDGECQCYLKRKYEIIQNI